MSAIHNAMLRAASLLVPRLHRREWVREWRAELWVLLHRGERWRATIFCSGAFRDAVCVRAHTAGTHPWRELSRLSNAGVCLAVLVVAAAVAAFAMWATPGIRESVWDHPLETHALIAAGALLLSPIFVGTRGFVARGVLGWSFLAAKSAVLMVIVFFGSFDIIPLLGLAPMQPQLIFACYVLAYRWAIQDQRRRCPACLRLLTNPVRIGHPAGTLLEWYGAEFICSEGHGVLHEPEPLKHSYCDRRWVRLDASWRELFQ